MLARPTPKQLTHRDNVWFYFALNVCLWHLLLPFVYFSRCPGCTLQRRLRRAFRAGARLVAAADGPAAAARVVAPPWQEAQALAEARLTLDDGGGLLRDEEGDDEDNGHASNHETSNRNRRSTDVNDDSESHEEALALAHLWARVHVVPRQPSGNFSKLLGCADVVLHPFPFDGSRTASETLALGKPTVTLPADQVTSLSRHTFP